MTPFETLPQVNPSGDDPFTTRLPHLTARCPIGVITTHNRWQADKNIVARYVPEGMARHASTLETYLAMALRLLESAEAEFSKDDAGGGVSRNVVRGQARILEHVVQTLQLAVGGDGDPS